MTISGLPLATGPSATGTSLASYGNNAISNSEISDNGRYGVEVIGGRNVASSPTTSIATTSASWSATPPRGHGGRQPSADSATQGIALRDGVDRAVVSGNIVTGGATNVYLRDSVAAIENNTLTDASRHAVSFVGDVGDTLVENTISGRGRVRSRRARPTSIAGAQRHLRLGRHDAVPDDPQAVRPAADGDVDPARRRGRHRSAARPAAPGRAVYGAPVRRQASDRRRQVVGAAGHACRRRSAHDTWWRRPPGAVGAGWGGPVAVLAAALSGLTSRRRTPGRGGARSLRPALPTQTDIRRPSPRAATGSEESADDQGRSRGGRRGRRRETAPTRRTHRRRRMRTPPTRAGDLPGAGDHRVRTPASSGRARRRRPGDSIELADGTYPGTFVTTRSGTAEQPIFLCGGAGRGARRRRHQGRLRAPPRRRAALAAGRLHRPQRPEGRRGRRHGRHRHPGPAPSTASATRRVHLRRHSTDNVVIGNTICDTGQRRDKFGEGVYVGTAMSNWCNITDCEPDRSDRNVVGQHHLGTTTAESVDIKEGTTGGVLVGNTFDGAGMTRRRLLGRRQGQRLADPGQHAAATRPVDGFQTHEILDGWGDANVFAGNTSAGRRTATDARASASPPGPTATTSSPATTRVDGAAEARQHPVHLTRDPHPSVTTDQTRGDHHEPADLHQPGAHAAGSHRAGRRARPAGPGRPHHRHRHRLPRRHPRGLHGRARLRRARRRRRRRQDRAPCRPARCRSSSPDCPSCSPRPLRSGRLRFTTDLAEAAEFGDVHFICVGTPQQHGLPRGRPDATSTRRRARLAPHLRRPRLVVGKSTVPGRHRRAGSTAAGAEHRPCRRRRRARLEPRVPARGLRCRGHAAPRPAGLRSDVATGPRQLLRAGLRADPRARAPRSSSPTSPPPSWSRSPPTRSSPPRSRTSTRWPRSARPTGGRRPRPRRRRSRYDDRIGGRFLQPGLGFGGGCLPKDIRAFAHRAEELGVGQAVAFLREVDAINARRRRAHRRPGRASSAGGDLAGVEVAALGAAFKPNSDDIRDAPALDVARHAAARRAPIVRVYDPEAMDNARARLPRAHYADGRLDGRSRRRRGRAAHRVGAVPAHRPRGARARWSRSAAIVDGRHALPAERGAPPAGTTARWGGGEGWGGYSRMAVAVRAARPPLTESHRDHRHRPRTARRPAPAARRRHVPGAARRPDRPGRPQRRRQDHR